MEIDEIDRYHSVIFSYMTENYNAAIEECGRILEKNSNSYYGRFYRAVSFIKNGLYSEAINDLNEAEKLKPNTYEVFYHRGISNFYNENFKQASEDFNKALEIEDISKEHKENAQGWLNKTKLN